MKKVNVLKVSYLMSTTLVGAIEALNALDEQLDGLGPTLLRSRDHVSASFGCHAQPTTTEMIGEEDYPERRIRLLARTWRYGDISVEASDERAIRKGQARDLQ